MKYLINVWRVPETYDRSYGPCFRERTTVMDTYMVEGTVFDKHSHQYLPLIVLKPVINDSHET